MEAKTKQNGMYMQLLAAAVLVVGSIGFACSSDDEFESNYEMETLAQSEMDLSNENGTALFQGIYIEDDGFAWINHFEISEYSCINSYAGWTKGWTGNTGVVPHCSPYYVVTSVYDRYTGIDEKVKYDEGVNTIELYDLTEKTATCQWESDNKLHIYISFKGKKKVNGVYYGQTGSKVFSLSFTYDVLRHYGGYDEEEEDE